MSEYYDFFEDHENKFYVQCEAYKPNVKGQLKQHISFWESIGTNSEILSILRDGYQLPLITTHDKLFSKNNKSALDNLQFVEQSVSDVIRCQYIVETPYVPHVVSLAIQYSKETTNFGSEATQHIY